MKYVFTLICCLAIIFSSFAQTGSIKGKLVDAEGKEGLFSASIVLKGTTQGTLSDFDGSFTIDDVPTGEQTVVISFVGYQTVEKTINVAPNTAADLGTIEVNGESIGLDEVSVVASVAIDRKTPVAVSTINSEQIQQVVGNQEFPEVLKHTPSIYVTKQGGGVGDARINVRGFDQRNVAVMINGIPVNDMENGWVYWSNWAGLVEVSSTVQVQRGLGASKLAVPSIGGSINIITNPAERKQGGRVTLGIGNDNYQKYGLSLSTGLMDNGYAITALGTFTQGDGYVDGTAFEASSYFLAISKTFNENHTLVLTGLGAPQWHNQRTVGRFDGITIGTYRTRGIKYNHLHGDYNGEEFSWRKNFYHKPKIFLNHYWTINEDTDLKTSAYVSLGRGGGTGPRGRITSAPDGWIFDTDSRLRNEKGEMQWDLLDAWQSGQNPVGSAAVFGTKDPEDSGQFAGQYTTTSDGNGLIRRASMNNHDWYGLLSTLNHRLSENLTLTAGLDARYYLGKHFRRVEDLLGHDAYLSRSDVNNPENYISNPDLNYDEGNILNYHNDGIVTWAGLFAQLEYTEDKFSFFVTLNGSNQGFKRVDYFNYLDSDSEQTTDTENFLGGVVKVGANYNIDDRNNIFANAGFISRQPIFDNVFINFVNDVNPDVENQSITSFEVGYGYRSPSFTANLNLYRTLWDERQFDINLDLDNGNNGLALFTGVSQLHQGVEVEVSYRPSRSFVINGSFALNDWTYNDNFQASITDTDLNQPAGTATIYADGLKVGDAAQTTVSLGFIWELFSNFKLHGQYYFADDLYANFDIDEAQFLAPGGEVIQLPNYELIDLGLSYRFNIQGYGATLRVNVNNITDEIYIAELDTNIASDLNANRGFFGFGRTWNATLRFDF